MKPSLLAGAQSRHVPVLQHQRAYLSAEATNIPAEGKHMLQQGIYDSRHMKTLHLPSMDDNNVHL